MKFKNLLIGLAIGSASLLIIMIILTLVLGLNWWITGGLGIFLGIGWFITVLIIMINKLNSGDIVARKMDSKDAINKEIESIKLDENNPDNIRVNNTLFMNVGAKDAEKTPILVMDCWGTELNQRRMSIINLKDVKNPSRLTSPDEDTLAEAIRLMADIPAEVPIKEGIKNFYQMGIPMTTEQKQKEEIKKIEEKTNL